MISEDATWRGKNELAFVSNKTNAIKYWRMLDDFYQTDLEKFYQ